MADRKKNAAPRSGEENESALFPFAPVSKIKKSYKKNSSSKDRLAVFIHFEVTAGRMKGVRSPEWKAP